MKAEMVIRMYENENGDIKVTVDDMGNYLDKLMLVFTAARNLAEQTVTQKTSDVLRMLAEYAEYKEKEGEKE